MMPREVTVEEVQARRQSSKDFILLDVREISEWQQGYIEGAVHLPLGQLESEAESLLSDKNQDIICYCAAGHRSLMAAEILQHLGYGHVVSMAGGIYGWMEASYSLAGSSSALSEQEQLRYDRHLRLPEVGMEGQKKLLEAKVLIVGAGGLGSPAAYYLAAAGVGTLGIVDDDKVELSNLQRQILHTTDRVGTLKVESAQKTLADYNPTIKVVTYPERLTSQNVETLLSPYDIIIDGSDNFPTRYLINDACVLLKKPLVHGSVQGFSGQVTVFGGSQGCYRCLYPEPPPAEMAPNCAEAGVLGVLPGVIGLLQAVEAVKLIIDQGDSLSGRLLCYDALKAGFSELKLKPDPECAYCAPGKPFPGFVDYDHFCTR
jgi:sulfur-carrier protein adenylyltransferase/sulfurtransferase